MPKQSIITDRAPRPGGSYSQGVKVGNMVFVAGQVPRDPLTGLTIGQTVEEQTRRVLDNVSAVLEAGGASMADVVKCTVHLSSLDLFDRFDAVYSTYFPDPKPVRTTVGSQLKGFLVEIDVIAVVEYADRADLSYERRTS